MLFQINFQVKEKKSQVKGYSVSATDLIEVIGPSKISSINGSYPSVHLIKGINRCSPKGGYHRGNAKSMSLGGGGRGSRKKMTKCDMGGRGKLDSPV